MGQPARGGPGQFCDVNRHADAAVLVSRPVLFCAGPSGKQICISLDDLLRHLYRPGGAGQICRAVFHCECAGCSGGRQNPFRASADGVISAVLYICACHLITDLDLEFQQWVCDHPAFGGKCQSAEQPGLIQRRGRVLGRTIGCVRACFAGSSDLYAGHMGTRWSWPVAAFIYLAGSGDYDNSGGAERSQCQLGSCRLSGRHPGGQPDDCGQPADAGEAGRTAGGAGQSGDLWRVCCGVCSRQPWPACPCF